MIDADEVSIEDLIEEIELQVRDTVVSLVKSLSEANIPQDAKDSAVERLWSQAEDLISQIPTLIRKNRSDA